MWGQIRQDNTKDGRGGMGKNTYVTLDAVLTGERIRSIIFEKGCTVRELQELLNLSCPQPVYRWMKGKILPSVDNGMWL